MSSSHLRIYDRSGKYLNFPIIHCIISQNVSKIYRNDVFDRTAQLTLNGVNKVRLLFQNGRPAQGTAIFYS